MSSGLEILTLSPTEYNEIQGSCAWKPRTHGFGRHVTRSSELAVIVRQMSPDASLLCFVGVEAVSDFGGAVFLLVMLCRLDAFDTYAATGILSHFAAVPSQFCLQQSFFFLQKKNMMSSAERLCDGTWTLVRTHSEACNPDDWRRQVNTALQFQQAGFLRTAQLCEIAARDV